MDDVFKTLDRGELPLVVWGGIENRALKVGHFHFL